MIFCFTCFIFHACLVLAEPLNTFLYDVSLGDGSQGAYPVHKFVTSKARALKVNFVKHSSACQDGLYYFLAPRGHKVPSPEAMILDENGTLIWSQHFSNKFGGQAYDLRVQQFQGKDVLTFWTGDDRIRGHGAGQFTILNSSYDVIHTVGAANGRFADLHEFIITPEGTAILPIFEVMKADTRPLGRKFNDVWNQAVWDCLFQEVNIETGELVFEWRASEHMNMTLTYKKVEDAVQGSSEQPFDWSHMNSIEKDALGNYLVSIRNTHSILYIDRKTKEVLWTLGGKANNFRDLDGGHAINFAWQHHARLVSATAFPKTYSAPRAKKGLTTRLMTLFDNAALDWNYEYGPSQSRSLLLELTYPDPNRGKYRRDTGTVPASGDSRNPLSEQDAAKIGAMDGMYDNHKVRIVREYVNPISFYAGTQGSAELLPPRAKGEDSRLLVSYGINAVVAEFYGNGSVACSWEFAARSTWEKADVQTYRVYKGSWVGKPERSPDVAVHKDNLYVSWNGATEIRQWLVQSHPVGIDDQGWHDVVTIMKEGFETTIPLKSDQYDVSNEVLRVQAIDKNGNILQHGISASVRQRTWGDTVKSSFDFRNGSWEKLFVWTVISLNVLLFLYRRVRKHALVQTKEKALGHVD